MHSVLKDNNIIMPLYKMIDSDFRAGRGMMFDKVSNNNTTKVNDSKNLITKYVNTINEINATKNKLKVLELRKKELEKDLLNDPITKKLIDEINKSQTDKKIRKK